MLHASASRATHRRMATPGGLTVLVRSVVAPTPGLHRQPSVRPWALREPQRAMHLLMTGLGALIMLSICGLSSFFVIADERRGLGAADTGTMAAESPYSISSRNLDPEPLSMAEVFSGSTVQMKAGDAPYRVEMTHIDNVCETATTGAVGRLIHDAGCTQVVRASLTAPYGGYQVTAGVFNLTDATSAARTADQVRALVESGDGSFAALAAGAAPGSDPQARPDSQVGWHDRGHYLVYCVISRPDNTPIAPDDRYAGQITADLLETYLAGEVIGARALNL
ncbi:hypothetical protein AB0M54_25915 [Actinoplanes sp. NPDC051470]|uniref:hypothetical protein n=1 Tax=Actinoplanes sp. NPDC051470 TaxID=3157224 RepID=UPI00344A35BF